MPICSDCGRALPVLSNAADTITLAVPRASLPALEHALRIGRNSQMMCSAPEAQAAMEELRIEVDAAIPDCARPFRDRHWAALGARVMAGEEMTASLIEDRRYSWRSQFRVSIHRIGDAAEDGYFSEETWGDRNAAEGVAENVRHEIERLKPMAE